MTVIETPPAAPPRAEQLPTPPIATEGSLSERLQWTIPGNLEQGLRLAQMYSESKLVPSHLQGKPADCFLVLSQASRWGMDFFAVAQATSVIHGKLMYEGKLVAAALYSTGMVVGRLRYEFKSEGPTRTVIVYGRVRGTSEEVSWETRKCEVRTENKAWDQGDRMLIYRGTRDWARIHSPEVMMGVITPDEAEEIREADATVIPDAKPAVTREVLDALQSGTPPAAAPPKPQPRITTAEQLEDLARKTAEACGATGKEMVKGLCTKHGVRFIRDLPKEKWDAVAGELDVMAGVKVQP